MVSDTPNRIDELSDDQLLQQARSAANGRKFRLRFNEPYEGSPLERRYDTRWRAEVALLENLAFWTQRDPTRMWRLFERSGLYEERSEMYERHPEIRKALMKEALELNQRAYGIEEFNVDETDLTPPIRA